MDIYIPHQQGKGQDKLQKDTTDYPIECVEFTTSMKIQDKWLGDILHQDGLAASTEATIKERTPQVKSAIFEIKGIIEDFRSQRIGGAVGALDLWELSVLPMLLNNSGTGLEYVKVLWTC